MSTIRLPSPVAVWDEPPTSGAARVLALLGPYLTTSGFWVFASRMSPPSGSTAGALVRTGSFSTTTTSTTSGLRCTRGPSGFVVFH
jgi:hypothetical protein